MGRVDIHPARFLGRDTAPRAAFAAAAILIAVSTWLIVVHHPRPAGAAAAFAAFLLLSGSVMADTHGSRTLAFLDSGLDRAFDGSLLTAIAFAFRHTDKWAAGAAICAVALTSLASYMRARGRALGYRLPDANLTRALRYAVIAIGLLGAWLLESMLAVIGLTLVSGTLDARRVMGQVAGAR
jgi:phosphatidylglycerophosphate synthase